MRPFGADVGGSFTDVILDEEPPLESPPLTAADPGRIRAAHQSELARRADGG